ncbi:DUF6596 domain-containing protein [Planotetraspora mira]|uniref:DUF6596 domain-containing protein n=1 Tax=Planotetraspora mira TaxID=58121 RepID=A0A8J3TY35_9ACTN|nr:hypothetical protein Pmi06nite_69040 [Planotetraspora mira]
MGAGARSDEPEVSGLLALLLVSDSRRTTRTDAQGRLLRLAEQNRAHWDQAAITEGRALVLRGMRLGRASRVSSAGRDSRLARGGA